jgi:hypothetical protein
VKTFLKLPVIGEFLYNVMTSRRALQGYYDRAGYHNPGLITDQLVDHIFSSAHQEDSHYPTLALLSKNLLIDAREPLACLRIPVAAIWGREEEFSSQEASTTYKKVNPAIETRILDRSSQQLQDEQATKFNSLIRELTGTGAPILQ